MLERKSFVIGKPDFEPITESISQYGHKAQSSAIHSLIADGG
jgi:hypothetical protein